MPWARAPPQIDVDPIVRRTGGERKSKSAPEYRSRQRSARKAKRRAQTNLRQVAVSAPVFENPGEANAAGDCGWARIFAAKWREAVGCGRRGADPGCLRIGPTEKQLPINRLWSDYEAGIPSGQAQNRMLSVNNPIADQAPSVPPCQDKQSTSHTAQRAPLQEMLVAGKRLDGVMSVWHVVAQRRRSKT
jgi:hypothetical protein